jgi:YidC/Oxa1 family membrane protein insertase
MTAGWLGMRDQYFCAIFYGDPGTIKQATIFQYANQSMKITAQLPEQKINSNDSSNYQLNLFLGPQRYEILHKSNYKLDKIIDFGMFRFISIPMLYLLKFFYQITNNYGFAIILLTLLIRAILWWPTQKSYSSMKNMQTAMNKMQPRLKNLKELYKDNPSKLNEETMKLYKEYQINPMGGCLPMLLQMPIFFALYSTLTSAVELKGANFMWIWKDLSTKDPLYILPIAMGLSMFLQQKMSTPPAATSEAAAQQKMMLYLMPAMLTFFSFMWPSGLLLYWVVSNVISIGQQVIINKSSK